MQVPKSLEELARAAQYDLVDFLRTDLALCSTFVDLTEVELAYHPEAAPDVFRKAERGYLTIEQFSTRVQDPSTRREIEQKLAALRTRLQQLRPLLGFA